MPGQNLGQQYFSQLQDVAAKGYNLGDSSWGYGNQAMTGAGQAANYGAQTAADASKFSQGLIPYAQSLESYGGQIGQMGFDPQNALYNRTLQQVQEQQRAGQAARGISMSPYGAGLEGDATRNFNIDWQNQQLKRATDAGASMAALGSSAAGLGSSAFNLGSGASDLAASASRLPYQTEKGMLQDQANSLANVGGQIGALNQPRQQVISNYTTAAGLGPAYSNAAANSQNAGTNQISSLAKLPLAAIGK
jgi:hypothetical protein